MELDSYNILERNNNGNVIWNGSYRIKNRILYDLYNVVDNIPGLKKST